MISVQSVFTALCLSSLFRTAFATYHWPSPQYDALEQFVFEGTDHIGLDIGGVTRNCVHRTPTTTSTVAAEWVRLAYHDMATHSVDDGTGGLDASIFFELDRPENVGAGNSDTVNLDFSVSANKYVSRADIIALGVSWAVASCGGPIISYKGGRTDALVAGRFGVPEPQQSLQDHTEAFRLQGFSPTEMISLVACGHTLGAVRNADFPDIVPNGDVTFDTTTAYDHAVVSEYLAGTTANPLVVAANQTLASDKRIFGSDSNATMNSMNSESAFASTCTSLLQRMVNTVPSGVTLTDTIEFLPVKVSSAEITMTGSQLILDVLLRLSQPPNVAIPANRSVKMFWCDRRGTFANCAGQTNVASDPVFAQAVVSPVTQSIGNTLPTYRFAAPITAAASVSKFWFQVDEGDGSPVQTYNNGGSGYVIDQDQVIYLPGLSSFSLGSSGGINYNLVVGVRSESTPTAATLHAFDKGGVGSGPQTDITVNLSPVTITGPPTVAPGYNTYTATINRPQISTSLTADFAVTIGGTVYNSDFKQTLNIGAESPPLDRTLSTVTTIPS